jgi:hypothetical protein
MDARIFGVGVRELTPVGTHACSDLNWQRGALRVDDRDEFEWVCTHPARERGTDDEEIVRESEKVELLHSTFTSPLDGVCQQRKPDGRPSLHRFTSDPLHLRAAHRSRLHLHLRALWPAILRRTSSGAANSLTANPALLQILVQAHTSDN